MPRPVLRRGDYAIEAVQPKHIEAIRVWRNRQIDVLRQKEPISREQQQRYYETEIWPNLDQPRPANILLSYLHGERHVGYGGLVHIAWEDKHAEVSYLLAPDLLEDDVYRGYHVAFLGLIQELAFDDLGLDYLTVETYPQRTAHMANLEMAGFHRQVQAKGTDSVFHRCVNPGQEG
jgi:RimJ/RimL family protein N-acetyltransferase